MYVCVCVSLSVLLIYIVHDKMHSSRCWQLLAALLWVLTGFGTNFHLHTGVVDPLTASEPCNAMMCIGCSMLAIQIRLVAVAVPPSSLVTSCTVTTILVIIAIKSTKVHVIMVSHSIKWPWCPSSLSNVETVLLVRPIHTKLLVHPRDFVPLLIL